jgi:hypothetical protein
MEIAMKMRIRTLDEYGYNGRDHYARKTDVGSTVLVIGMDAQVVREDSDGLADYLGPAMDGGIAAFPSETNEDTMEVMWTCLTADGRTVQMMDHEVEVVK